MSQNRILTTINRVEPTKTIFIKTFPCEHKAAYIRNEAVEAMERNDIPNVAYRYLLTRKEENYTFSEIRSWGSFTSIILAASLILYNNAYSEDNDSNIRNMLLNFFIVFMLISSLAPFTYCVINTNNTRRYKETKEGCEAWLKEKINIDTLTQINKFDLPIREIITFFQKEPKKLDGKFENDKSILSEAGRKHGA